MNIEHINQQILNLRKQSQRGENPFASLESRINVQSKLRQVKESNKRKQNLEYETREKIARVLKRSIGQICGLTKNWTLLELKGALSDAEAFTKNTPARLWNLLKEVNLKHKNEKTTRTSTK